MRAGEEAPSRAAAIEALHRATAIFTTRDVVDDLLRRLGWPAGGGRLVDPSCGDGAFVGRALDMLLQGEPGASDREIAERIEGWEFHPATAAVARRSVADVLERTGRSPGSAAALARRLVRCRDFLTQGPVDRGYDIVAGNPPYLRGAQVPAVLRSDYRAVVPAFARADLLHAFIERCERLLRPGGAIAIVAADRFLMNTSAGALREVLGRTLGVEHLRRLDARTAFYRPKTRRKGTPPRVHPVALVLREGADLPRLTRDPQYPDLVPGGEDSDTRPLAEVAQIRIAPWLARDGVFVVDELVARSLDGADLVPAVGTRDILDDDSFAPARRWALRTEGVVPSRAVLVHLEAATASLSARGRRSPFWLPPESWKALPLDRPALAIPRIVKVFRVVDLPAGVLPTSHNLTIVAPKEPADLPSLRAALQSDAVKEWVSARALRVDGGYMSVTPELLQRLPVALRLRAPLAPTA